MERFCLLVTLLLTLGLTVAPSQSVFAQAPSAPTGVSATGGDSEVTLDWNANTESDLARYRIYRDDEANVQLSVGNELTTVQEGTTEFTDTNVSNGTSYYYVITAVDNSGNESPGSSEVSATPTNTPPAAPTGLQAMAGDGEVALSWDANNESDLAEYDVYRRTSAGPGAWSVIQTVSAGQTSYTDTGVSNGTAYDYAVQAVDNSGASSNSSNTVTATPTQSVPAAPTGLTATAADGEVSLSWDANSESDLQEYEIHRKTSSGSYSGPTATVPSGQTSYLDTGVSNSNVYNYVVKAVDDDGDTSPSSIEVTADPTQSFPADPTGLTATAGDGEVSLSWDANSEPDLANYAVYRQGSSGVALTPANKVTTVGAGTTSFTDTGVSNGTSYWYVVIAIDEDSDESGSSNEVSATPTQSVPAAPTNLTATAGDGSVDLIWDANDESDLVEYHVWRRASGGSWPSAAIDTVAAPDTTYTDSGVTNGTSYEYAIKAVDDDDDVSGNSNLVTVTPTAAPDAPTGLTASAGPGDGEITLTWNANDESDLDEYNVYRSQNSGVGTGNALVGTVSDTTFTDANAGEGTQRYYVVTAVDTDDNESAVSNEANATGADLPPAVPSGFTATAGDGEITLSWDANTESDLDEYKIYRSTSPNVSTSGSAFHTVSGGTTSFTNGGLSNGTTYYYALTAEDTDGNESSASNEKWATPQSFSSPPATPIQSFRSTGAGLMGVERGALDLGDFDNSGGTDLVVVGLNSSNTPTARVYTNDGSGTFTNAGLSLTGVKNGDVRWADLDDDGYDDIVVIGSSGGSPVTSVYLNNDGNGVSEVSASGLPNLTDGSISVGTFAGNDSHVDLLLSGTNSSGSAVTAIYPGNGDGTFGTAQDVAGPAVAQSSSAVLPGNDAYSVFTGRQDDGTHVAKINEAGVGVTDLGLGVAYGSSSWADFDRDGDLDLLISGEDTQNNRIAKILENNGGFSFTELSGAGLTGVMRSSSDWGNIEGDTNGPDLVVTGEDLNGNRTTTVYRNDGGGTFTAVTSGLTGVRFGDSAFGDFDGDGILDLVVVGESPSGAPTATVYEAATSECPVEWQFDLAVSESNSSGSASLSLGQANTATAGLDTACGESELPPSFPGGFKARFVSINGTGVDLGLGTHTDLRPPNVVTGKSAQASEAVWKVSLGGDYSGSGIEIDPVWSSGYSDVSSQYQLTLEYTNSGGTQTVELTGSNDPSSVFIANANVSTVTIRLTDAPPQDITVSGGDASTDTDIVSGFNLKSIPVDLDDMTVSAVDQLWRSGNACNAVFSYSPNSGYTDLSGGSNVLEAGVGYIWSCQQNAGSADFVGQEVLQKDIDVEAGWNVVGLFNDPIAPSEVAPQSLLASSFYAFDPSSGLMAVGSSTDLKPGAAYWVKISQDGTLEMDPSTPKSAPSKTTATSDPLANAAQLTVSDEEGHQVTTHLAPKLPGETILRHELPPKLPGEYFDVRFDNGTRVAPAAKDASTALELQGTSGTITLQADGLTADQVVQVSASAGSFSGQLTATSPTLQVPAGTKALNVTVRSTPAETRLAKSYPNPARTQSTIEYTLAEQADVTLEVYDVLGRKVATLVDASKQAGVHTTQLEASSFQSGVYFVRMRAGDVQKTQRLTIVK